MNHKTKRKGGMFKTAVAPLGRATYKITEAVGKDYLQKKMPKIIKGLYEDPTLIDNPSFLVTGKKPVKQPTTHIYANVYDKENSNPNLGGKTKKRKNNRKRKTRKNIK